MAMKHEDELSSGDLRVQASTNGKPDSHFGVCTDLKYAYFRKIVNFKNSAAKRENRTFVAVDLKTGEQIDFICNEDIKCIKECGVWGGISVYLCEEAGVQNTIIIAPVIETDSGNVFIVSYKLFMKEKEGKAVIVCETSVVQSEKQIIGWRAGKNSQQQISAQIFVSDVPYEAYCIAYCWNETREMKKTTTFVVRKFTVNSKSGHLLFGDQKVEFKTMNDYWDRPFIDNTILYFLPLYSVNNSLLNAVKLNSISEKPFEVVASGDNKRLPTSSTSSLAAPVKFGNETYFYFLLDNEKGSLWSFNAKKSIWSIVEEFSDHIITCFVTLNILSDGSAFLHGNCSHKKCTAKAHIYQFDLSVPKQISLDEGIVGEGSFSKIIRSSDPNYGKIAIKIMNKFGDDKRTRHVIKSAIAEARRLKHLFHENVVKGYGFKIEEKRFLMFMELMELSVKQVILQTDGKKLTEECAFNILIQALNGLVYLHTLSKPIIHRDIKCKKIIALELSSNILLDNFDFKVVKLGDFGVAEIVKLDTGDRDTTDYTHAPHEQSGTAYWQAPEVLVDEPYGRKADVWSIGCTLVEMLTGYPPYCDLPPTNWAIKTYKKLLTYSPRQLIPDASSDVVDILEKTFRRQWKKLDDSNGTEIIRPNSLELFKHIEGIIEKRTDTKQVAKIASRMDSVKLNCSESEYYDSDEEYYY